MKSNKQVSGASDVVPDRTVERKAGRRSKLTAEVFEELYSPLKQYLRSFASNEDAEDILQDLFGYHVFLKFEESQIKSPALLRRKCYQLFCDLHRRRVRRGEFITDNVPEPEIGYVSKEAYTNEEEAALKEKFWSGFPGIELELTEQQREILYRHARYGFTYAELSEQSDGLPTSTISDWVKLGRKTLAEYLNSETK